MPRVFTEEQRERKNKWQRENYHRNREKINEYSKEYYKKNKKKIYEQQKKYHQTPNGKRSQIISNWKRYGLVSTDYNLLYENYLKSTNCEECGIEYGKFGDGTRTFKCMDHSHETGLFRNFICCRCNIRRR